MAMKCLQNSCVERVYAKGFCKRHYQRAYMRNFRANPEYNWRKHSKAETVKRCQARWLLQNGDHRRQYIRDRYKANIDKEREYQRIWRRNWRKNNPEKARLADKRRSKDSL